MIRVTNDRNEALEAGWKALSERSKHITGFQFEDYEVRAFKNDDIVIGMLLTKGPELHVAIISEYRKKWLSRRIIKLVIGEIIKKYGYAVTAVMSDNKIGQDFVERLGFKRQHFSDGMIHYRITP